MYILLYLMHIFYIILCILYYIMHIVLFDAYYIILPINFSMFWGKKIKELKVIYSVVLIIGLSFICIDLFSCK